MNADHAEDSLPTCRTLDGCPEATRVRATGLDADGMDFAVTVDDIEVPVWIPGAAAVRPPVVRRTMPAAASRPATTARRAA
ncbi:DUF2470 domain-containing protein [Micromonospora sp. KC207]|uniref:DUF2470 domain-containing protein n=1 Tax=Micromonospora sp. KC207 TaxID=2530377 RepID=UPI00104D1080|nr:DUF2470 domain-containing protein [Micromonospora sp. KC207]TDC59946.1 DUF2470 domain-containing protein [Micromonospora sp. KC207]